MIVVKVELWPQGREEDARPLGFAEIANDGQLSMTSEGREGTYAIRIFAKTPGVRRLWRTGGITGFDRKQFGVWDLLMLCLFDALKDRIGRMRKGRN